MSVVFTANQGSMDGAVTTLARNVMTRTSAATGEETFTAAMVVNGIYHQTGTPGAVAKLFPSAASMWALIPGAIVGTSFDFIFHNGGDGEVTLTTDTGTTVTLYGTATVTAAKTRKCKIVFTSATAASCYCMAELA